jgi:N-methylhydantoinase B/oxoprolinase/acetone carboxylase alpha subunit
MNRYLPRNGLEGGEPGLPARVTIRRKSGRIEQIYSQIITLDVGDEITIETPGGGGYGAPCE